MTDVGDCYSALDIIHSILIYNPPQTSLFRVDSSVLVEAMFNHRDEVVKCLGRKVAKDRNVTAVLGDINLPDVCWSPHTATSDYLNKFLTALDDLDLLQIVDFSTIVSGNIFDLLCVSDPHRFIVFRGATAYSDHFPVFAHVFAASSVSHFTTKRSVTYSKSCLNSESFSRAISPLYSILHSNCHNEFIDKFNETVYQALDSSCRKITSSRRKDFSFYFSSHSIQIANKLRNMNNSNCFNPQYLSQLENEFSNLVELDKTLLIQRFLPNSSKHAFMFLTQFKSTQPVPTKFFGYANRSRVMFQLVTLSITISILFIKYLKVVLLLVVVWLIRKSNFPKLMSPPVLLASS